LPASFTLSFNCDALSCAFDDAVAEFVDAGWLLDDVGVGDTAPADEPPDEAPEECNESGTLDPAPEVVPAVFAMSLLLVDVPPCNFFFSL